MPTNTRPLTAITHVRYDLPSQRFSLRGKAHNLAGRLFHQRAGLPEQVEVSNLEPWQLDSCSLTITCVVEAMARPGGWCAARFRSPQNPFVVTDDEAATSGSKGGNDD